MAKTYVIDGKRFNTLEEFYEEISEVLIPDKAWGKNLDAFNDILYDFIDSDEKHIVIRWVNSDISREKLGYPETVRQLKKRLQKCSAGNRQRIKKEIISAQRQEGPTVFDWLIGILTINRPVSFYEYEIILE